MTLTAYPTPGFTFESWTDACAGQQNPCTLTTSGAALGVIAVFSGRYVPPAPPPRTGPSLRISVSGDCPGCLASALGTGFQPNSSITLLVKIRTPPLGSIEIPVATTDAGGTGTFEGLIGCDFDGPYMSARSSRT